MLSLLETLEPRQLLFAGTPNDLAQYMVELMNRARANPTAEAQKFNIDLNEGISPPQITATPKQPLAFNPQLTYAAQQQSVWLIDNTTLASFSHSGPGGNQPQDRAIASGYTVPSGDYVDEDAGINLYMNLGSLTALTESQYGAYFDDSTNKFGGRGHRIQMLDDNVKEVGADVITGAYNYTDPNTNVTTAYQGFESVIDFGFHDTVPYLTGVAYNDTVVADNFYTPGEGLPGLYIAAVRTSDQKVFTTRTFSTGGYTLPLEAGTYNVYGFGAGLEGFVAYNNVTIGTDNVKRDFTPAQASVANGPFALFVDGALFINGTTGDDSIQITRTGNTYTVTRSGASPQSAQTFDATQVKSIQVNLGDGNDQFIAGPGVQAIYVNGGIGNDTIVGSDGNDTLTGAGGKDRVDGGAGDDRVNGGSGNDILSGSDGNDRVYGDEGKDKLYGDAGVDRLFGGGANDYLSGGSSNDKLYGEAGNDTLDGDNQNDLLDGGSGNDVLSGNNGNDSLVGGAGADQLFGNKGNDTFNSADGTVDTLDGGAGVNTGTMDPTDIRTLIS